MMNKLNKTCSIICPPPNATGKLHLGHAFQQIIMDIIARYHRSLNIPTSWIPGSDHAGIAGQIYLTEQFKQLGINTTNLDKPDLIKLSQPIIADTQKYMFEQMKRLNISLDWGETIFSLDDNVQIAVNAAFKLLYNDNLIYQGKRMTYFDPICKTCISDLEVKHQECMNKFYTIQYRVVGSERCVLVSTTRPETIFGDTAILVNPDDPHYRDLIGYNAIIPLVGRLIPIIAAKEANINMGTGCLKVTPGHDFKDYQLAQTYNLEIIDLFDSNGNLANYVPTDYIGLSMQQARIKIINDLKQELVKIESKTSVIPLSDKSLAVLEPRLMTQWFLKTNKLTPRVKTALQNGEITVQPSSWLPNLYAWLDNVQDWCLSRQIWWGHDVPISYTRSDHKPYYCAQQSELSDPDVLDTWFSSGLWPLVLRGWPNNITYQPHDYLVTGFDILFFWFIRMAMFSYYFAQQPPCKHLIVTGLIRDQYGQKMSKSKGNIIDPLTLIEQQDSLDCLRLTLAQLNTPTSKVNFDLRKLTENKRFIQKLYNIIRCMKLYTRDLHAKSKHVESDLNTWIIYSWQKCMQTSGAQILKGRTDLAIQNIKEFVYLDYCGIYLEIFKQQLKSNNDSTTLQVTGLAVLTQLLQHLSCFIPDTALTLLNQIPKLKHDLIKVDIKPVFEEIKEIIIIIRSLSKQYNVDQIWLGNTTSYQMQHLTYASKACGLKNLWFVEPEDKNNYIKQHIGNINVFIKNNKLVNNSNDLKDIAKLESLLKNSEFMLKAPKNIVELMQTKLDKLLKNKSKNI